jgi:hypothetical protein
VTTSAIRRRYGWGAARLCIEAQPVRHEETPPLLPNATSGAATVLIGGLAVFALLRSIEPPEEKPSEIQIVQLAAETPPPEPEPMVQPPEPEPEPVPEEKPPPPPEPVVVAQVTPKPLPKPIVHKAEPPKRREPPPMPKPEPIHVAPEPAPEWKRAALTPPPPEPKPVTPPPAVRKPPVVMPAPAPVEPPKEMAESAPAWKPVALAQAPRPKAAAPAPHVTIDAVNTPASAPAELPSRSVTLPPGVPAAPKTTLRAPPPNLRPVVPAAAAPDFVADAAAPPAARGAVPQAPSAPPVQKRLPPKGAMAMPGIGNASASESAAVAGDARDYQRPGVTAPPAPTARSEPNAKLRGVPLGSLAACRSDRLEDDLKQKVLAAVRNREECESAAGRYRFVETKNLNAFLMWIERAPGRAEGDRCAELSYALSCLRGGAR